MAIGDGLLSVLALVGALGSGLMAGLFFAFSISVMRGLARRPAPEAIAAMQAFNAAIIHPLFLLAFLGTGVACAVLVIAGLLRWTAPQTPYVLVGGTLYLVGGLLVTFAFNVPRNEALDAAAPEDPASAELWRRYLSAWTAWNHVRALACLAAAGALTLAV